jgi:alkylhydroperoxidase family enzyme
MWSTIHNRVRNTLRARGECSSMLEDAQALREQPGESSLQLQQDLAAAWAMADAAKGRCHHTCMATLTVESL